jgi:alpha-amylase/alpha-mannosidase (GH57 family)
LAPRVIVHGHFYQPPRENPWTGEIDVQPSAAPFHDWNERIYAECYRPNAFAQVPTPKGELTVNNFERISFNVGPTLLAWLDRAHPETHARVIEADRKSLERLGFGNAMAQAYHHTILPLSPPRDIRTQVRWGLADFRHRFGREAEGMWLPETAVNDDVLGVLIEEGVKFTLLAPHQAESAVDVSVSYRYVHRDGSGRSIALFFYDADIARAIAFENAASSADRFMDLFLARSKELIHCATDGETFGHHWRFADLGLAYALFMTAEERAVEVTNYARELADHPGEQEVRLAPGEGTSWSCPHGIGRWARDCGCSTRSEPGWNQAWREPLRAALDVLRDAADEAYERLGAELFKDPWETRDRYVEVVVGKRTLGEFLEREALGPLSPEEVERAATLLSLQESALSLYTSCAWFFSDIGGIETVQILRYAARTFDLMEELGQPTPSAQFLAELEKAESNEKNLGTGSDIFLSLR